jgi:hypothetical protein
MVIDRGQRSAKKPVKQGRGEDPGDLSRGGVENRNEGEQKNIAKKCVGFERLPKAPARAQMRGQRKEGSETRTAASSTARLRNNF